MRVFVTGATGFIGSAVVQELIAAGHDVAGLARSDKAAASLTAAGAAVHRGSLEDPGSLRSGAAASDGVIHTAFNNVSENTDFAASAQADLRAIEALGEALAGSGRPLVVTSGTGLLAPGRLGMEEDEPDPGSFNPRVPAERAALSLAGRGVRVSIARLHGVGDEGVPFRDIAEVIGRHLNLPVTTVSREEAEGHFGWLAPFVLLDSPASSALTQKLLEWHPAQPGLIPDLDKGHYFNDGAR